jgi:putative FmdB family regulatory protein
MKLSLDQEARKSLHMPATQPATRREGMRLVVCLRNSHDLILNRRNFLRGVFFMPIFEYICKECQHEFETLIFGKQTAECPKCQSKKLEPQLSLFAVSAKSSGATQPFFSAGPAGPCGSCGDPRGPGSCSLKDLD